jgi:hypothetical protein
MKIFDGFNVDDDLMYEIPSSSEIGYYSIFVEDEEQVIELYCVDFISVIYKNLLHIKEGIIWKSFI